jgi:alkanesulfonate monooxygenase SsuD/methylene tetrahydromethanopterin reductase-like flavin-dependent oxidoreductase (luciferase family)
MVRDLSRWVTHPWVAAGRDRIRLGIAYGPQIDAAPDWSVLRDFVQTAEGVGVDSYWSADHPITFPDCWATLAALAATTTKIRLGPLVNCVHYRSPAALARLGADVDRISGGRLALGLGIGDARWEFEALRIPFAGPRDRQEALAETVRIVSGLWGATPFTFEGRHFGVHAARVTPGPVQIPRVPLLIAGGGERVTLRQVAEYADACNFAANEMAGSAFTLEHVRRKFAALRSHCDEVGRPADSVIHSHAQLPVVVAATPAAARAKLEGLPTWLRADIFRASTVAGTPDEVRATYQALVDAGVRYFIAAVAGNDTETVRLLADEVMPALKLES